MSIEINVITGRKKALTVMLKAVSDFVGGSSNKRVSIQMNVNLNPKEDGNKC